MRGTHPTVAHRAAPCPGRSCSSLEQELPISSVPALQFPERSFCHDPGVPANTNASLDLGRVEAVYDDL